jgi:type 1 fimbria pilin
MMIFFYRERLFIAIIQIVFAAFFIFYASYGHATVSCYIPETGKEYSIDAKDIIVPLDLPNGTVIHQQARPLQVNYYSCHAASSADSPTTLGLQGSLLNQENELPGINVAIEVTDHAGKLKGPTNLESMLIQIDDTKLTCQGANGSCNSVSGDFSYRYTLYKKAATDFVPGPGSSSTGRVFTAYIGDMRNPKSPAIAQLAISGLNNIHLVECGVTFVAIPTINFGTVYNSGQQANDTGVLVSKNFALSYNKQCDSGSYKLRVQFSPIVGELEESRNLTDLIPAGNKSVIIRLRDADNNKLLSLHGTETGLFPQITKSGTYSKNLKAELLWNPNMQKKNRKNGEFHASLDVEVTYY